MSRDNPKMIQAIKDKKPPMERIPAYGLAAVARVMASGAAKYGVNNWRIDHIRATTYVGAIYRHAILEWADGVDADRDTGEHPLAHVVACCLIVMDAERKGTLIDDRTFAESLSRSSLPAQEPHVVDGWVETDFAGATHIRVLCDRPCQAELRQGEIVKIGATRRNQTSFFTACGWSLPVDDGGRYVFIRPADTKLLPGEAS